MTDTQPWSPAEAARLWTSDVAAEAERDRLRHLCARLAALGDRLLRCAERELVPGADLAREWALAREGVGGG